LRAEGEGLGVRVSVICPVFVDTAIYENAIGVKIDKDEFLARLRKSAVLARRVPPRSVGAPPRTKGPAGDYS
jgi:NAD(P)-dependent dehydrogenase (short-subunit alcohol dehydrogenase family)